MTAGLLSDGLDKRFRQCDIWLSCILRTLAVLSLLRPQLSPSAVPDD